MAKLTTAELIEAFKELSLIELSEFVKAFEETFEVTAAAPAAVAVAAPAAGGAVEAEEERSGDPIGWARVLTGAESCGFCAMLASA